MTFQEMEAVLRDDHRIDAHRAARAGPQAAKEAVR